MTDEQHRQCRIFTSVLRLLDVDDAGLTDKNDFDDLQAIAQVSAEVKEFTSAGDTPEELMLHRVATLTEKVLMTWGNPEPATVKEWLIARAELLQIRIGV